MIDAAVLAKGGESVKSGPLGLAVILLLCVACYFLFKSMSKHLRKVREEFPEDPPTPDRPAPDPSAEDAVANDPVASTESPAAPVASDVSGEEPAGE